MLPTNVANRIFKGLQEAGIEVEIKGG
jgi:hypothetical protein